MFRDSLGNTYASLPAKKANKGAKGAKPGPKHGRKSKYAGPQKKHGINTGSNGSPFYVHQLAHAGLSRAAESSLAATQYGSRESRVRWPRALETGGTISPRGVSKSPDGNSGR